MSKDKEDPLDEGFLSAWSRRKRAAEQEESAQADPKASAAAEAEPTHEPEPTINADELAALPSLDEINGQTDLEPFLKSGVPASLRKAALRKVWLSNVLISGHDDPAVDYAWDWNAPEGVPGAGGALSKDSVAKMVGDLMNRDRPKSEDADQTDLAKAGAQADAETDPSTTFEGNKVASVSDAEPALPNDPVRRAGQQTPKPKQSDEDAQRDPRQTKQDAPNSEQASDTPVRRHGGAMPE